MMTCHFEELKARVRVKVEILYLDLVDGSGSSTFQSRPTNVLRLHVSFLLSVLQLVFLLNRKENNTFLGFP